MSRRVSKRRQNGHAVVAALLEWQTPAQTRRQTNASLKGVGAPEYGSEAGILCLAGPTTPRARGGEAGFGITRPVLPGDRGEAVLPATASFLREPRGETGPATRTHSPSWRSA